MSKAKVKVSARVTTCSTRSEKREIQIERVEHGHFAPGLCPNPLGRKPMDKSLRAWMRDKSEDVVRVVYDQAMKGNLIACKLWLDRCVPMVQPQDVAGIDHEQRELVERNIQYRIEMEDALEQVKADWKREGLTEEQIAQEVKKAWATVPEELRNTQRYLGGKKTFLENKERDKRVAMLNALKTMFPSNGNARPDPRAFNLEQMERRFCVNLAGLE